MGLVIAGIVISVVSSVLVYVITRKLDKILTKYEQSDDNR